MKNRIWERERAVPFVPETGKVYRNEGGGDFQCVDPIPSSEACWFRNIATGWEFIARGVQRYSDGTIDWAGSVQGHFADEELAARYAQKQATIRHQQISLANALLCLAL